MNILENQRTAINMKETQMIKEVCSADQGMQVKIPIRKGHTRCVHASLTAPVKKNSIIHIVSWGGVYCCG